MGVGLPGPGFASWMSLMAEQLGQEQVRPPFLWPAAFHKFGHLNAGRNALEDIITAASYLLGTISRV